VEPKRADPTLSEICQPERRVDLSLCERSPESKACPELVEGSDITVRLAFVSVAPKLLPTSLVSCESDILVRQLL
jgi:hypothetical protein